MHSLVDNVAVMFESFDFAETVSAVAKVRLFVDSFERRNIAELQRVQLVVLMVQVEAQPLVRLEGQWDLEEEMPLELLEGQQAQEAAMNIVHLVIPKPLDYRK